MEPSQELANRGSAKGGLARTDAGDEALSPADSGRRHLMRQLTWGLLSAATMALAAWAACALHPDAAAGVKRTGQYRPGFPAFALELALPLAILQATLLPRWLPGLLPSGDASRRTAFRVSWLACTTAGLALALVPLWGIDLDIMRRRHIGSVLLMVPGLALMGWSQSLVLDRFGRTPPTWTRETVLAGAVGCSVGMMAAALLGLSDPDGVTLSRFGGEVVSGPFEVVVAACIGLGIGLAQGRHGGEARPVIRAGS